MGDRNRKAKRKEHEIDGPSHGSNRSTAARVSGAYGGGDVGGSSAGASGTLPIQDNPGHGQNAARSVPVADQSLARTTGLQPGVELGGSAPRHGLQLQGSAQDSGNRLPTPKVCPDCHNSVFSNNIICVFCACEAAPKLMGGSRPPGPPSPPLQRQQRPPHGLQGRSSPANLEFVADCPTGQQRRGATGGPLATENWRPGLLGPPQENPEPRASESPFSTRRRGTLEKQRKPIPKTKTYVCPGCRVNTCSSNRVLCQPCATARAAVPATGQQQLVDMADLIAAICPVGERSVALGGAVSSQPQSHDQRPSRPQQLQQLDASAEQQEQLRRFAELAANIWPVEQRGGAPGGSPAIENSRPGLLQPLQENPEPRAGESLSTRRRGPLGKQPMLIPETATYVCPVCHDNTCSSNGAVCQSCLAAWAVICEASSSPQSHDQSPLRPQQHQQQQSPTPVGAVAQQRQEQLRRFAELFAAIWPVEERNAASGGRSAVQLGHPGLKRLPQEHPVPRADKPVGFHCDPVVIGRGPALEDGWCPACRFNPARTVLQPRRHDCVCYTCLNVDRIVCPVCASA